MTFRSRQTSTNVAGEMVVVSGDHAPTERGDQLEHAEAENRRTSERAHHASIDLRAQCVGTVLEQNEVMPLGDLPQAHYIRGVAEHVRRKQESCARRNGSFQLIRVNG